MKMQAALSGDNPSPTTIEPSNRAMMRGIGLLFVSGAGYADMVKAAAHAAVKSTTQLGPLLGPLAAALALGHSTGGRGPAAAGDGQGGSGSGSTSDSDSDKAMSSMRYSTNVFPMKCYNNRGDRHTIAQRLWWVPLPRSVGRGALARGS